MKRQQQQQQQACTEATKMTTITKQKKININIKQHHLINY